MTLQAAFLLQRLLNQAGAESHRLGGAQGGGARCRQALQGWQRGGGGGWDKVTGEEKVGEASSRPRPQDRRRGGQRGGNPAGGTGGPGEAGYPGPFCSESWSLPPQGAPGNAPAVPTLA